MGFTPLGKHKPVVIIFSRVFNPKSIALFGIPLGVVGTRIYPLPVVAIGGCLEFPGNRHSVDRLGTPGESLFNRGDWNETPAGRLETRGAGI